MKTKEKVNKLKLLNPSWGYKKMAKEVGISYTTARYHMNDKYRLDLHQRRADLTSERMNSLRANFGGKCSICGYDKCLNALQFHHVDPASKIGAVSDMMRGIRGNKTLDARNEAKKCILVCANCHVELHS